MQERAHGPCAPAAHGPERIAQRIVTGKQRRVRRFVDGAGVMELVASQVGSPQIGAPEIRARQIGASKISSL